MPGGKLPNYKKKIRRAARRNGVRPELLLAQLTQESGLNPNAVSPVGARGIAQFMPGTAASYGVDLYDGRAGDDIRGAARHMADLLRKYGGSERKALAAYNAGAGAVDKYGGVPPYAETQNYVKTILSRAGDPAPDSQGGPRVRSQRSQASYETVPGVDNSELRQQLLLSYLSGERGKPNALLELKTGLDSAQDTPAKRVKVADASGSIRTTPGSSAPSGETTIKKIIRAAEQRGLQVGEHPSRGGVAPVHADGSWHYKAAAADITGDPKALAAFKKWLRRTYGRDLEELIFNSGGGKNLKNGRKVGPGFYSGHETHLHVADDD
jgi:hypothetical protein